MDSPSFSAGRRSALLGRRAGAGGEPTKSGGADGSATALTETLSAVRIDISGSVQGEGEDVMFAGPVEIRARAVAGLDMALPDVTLFLDLSAVRGIGAVTGRQYVTACEEALCRPLNAARDAVQIGFVFQPSASTDFSECRVGMANFILGYDVPARRLAAALGSIGGQAA